MGRRKRATGAAEVLEDLFWFSGGLCIDLARMINNDDALDLESLSG
jgi:hypothetical protein